MTYSKSVVLIAPGASIDAVNALLDEYGFGLNNLSVSLNKSSDGAAYAGCHVWADQALVDYLLAADADLVQSLIISSVEGGNALDNWNQTLSAAGLEITTSEP